MNSSPNKNRNEALLAGLIFVAFMFGVHLLTKCEPEEPTPTPAPEQQRITEAQADSIKSLVEVKFRQRETKLIQAYSDTLAGIKAKLPKSKEKAAASVKRYQNTPTIANCDTAIAELQNYASEIETGLAVADSIIKGQSRVIGSFAGTVARKDSVLAVFNAGWAEANAENAKLRKQNGKKWALGVGVGYGLTPNGHGPVISIGVQRNLFRF